MQYNFYWNNLLTFIIIIQNTYFFFRLYKFTKNLLNSYIILKL